MRRRCSIPGRRSASSAAASLAACWRWPRLGSGSSVTSSRPIRNSPAFDVVHRVTCADYADTAGARPFRRRRRSRHLRIRERAGGDRGVLLPRAFRSCPIRMSWRSTQDRLAEKNFVTGLGIGTAAYAAAVSPAEFSAAIRADRPAGGAQDAAVRLRRQGPGDHRRSRHPPKRRGAPSARSPASSKRSCRSRCEVSVVAARAP